MRNVLKIICLLLALVLLLPACSGESGSSSEKEQEKLLPIKINGTEIRVGETTVQALLDQGMNVGWVDENYERVDVDPDMELEPNSYYTGGSINVNENIFAQISFVTEEEAIPLGEAVIARLEFYMHSEDDPAVLSKIEFDGVPVTELTREKAGEMYPDWTGDEVMWLKYGLEYKYDLNFDMTSGQMTKFTVEREYDVDWSGDQS
jgi:hypothetical protein|nr:hypothetical protein [Acutalibacter muris]